MTCDDAPDRIRYRVNHAWGAHQDHIGAEPFWEQPLSHWEGMFERGVRDHILASAVAAPILVGQRHGLIVTVTFWDWWKYTGSFYWLHGRGRAPRPPFELPTGDTAPGERSGAG